MPHGRLLIRITEPQKIRLSVLASNQPKSNGDALGANAARDRQRRVAGIDLLGDEDQLAQAQKKSVSPSVNRQAAGSVFSLPVSALPSRRSL